MRSQTDGEKQDGRESFLEDDLAKNASLSLLTPFFKTLKLRKIGTILEFHYGNRMS